MTDESKHAESFAIDDLNQTLNIALLDRWWRRFQRSLSYYAHGVFEDEQFETLVAALVTGATIEGLLWLGIQFCGYRAKEGRKKDLALGGLITEGVDRGLIYPDLDESLKAFANIRNDFAHDIDYRLTDEAVSDLRALLPEASEHEILRALANVVEPSDGLIMTLAYEQIALLTYEAVRAAYDRKYGEN
jgi:hypothetical protein